MSEPTTDNEGRKRVEESSGIRFTIPWLGGTKIEIKGRDVFFTAIIVGVAMLLVRFDAHQEATAAIAKTQSRTEEHIQEMIYVLSLSEKKRAELNLQMPDSLRKKLATKQP